MSYAPVSSITGTDLPGFATLAFKAPYSDSSAGYLTVEDAVVSPAVQTNGFASSVPHQHGFALQSVSRPVGAGGAFSDALAYSDASTATNTVAGTSVVRHYSYRPEFDSSNALVQSRWVIEHNLIESGIEYSTFALWSYHGSYVPGYLAGRPSYWGSYVYGSRTVAEQINDIPTGEYAGLAGAHWLFPNLFAVNAYYGTTSVSYDAGSKSVSVTVQLTQYAPIVYANAAFSLSDGIDGVPSEPVVSNAVQCTATLNEADNSFTCTLPSMTGTVTGRFYGPNGKEVAGVFRRHTLSGSGTNWGIIGGFAAKSTE